ncbi:MAG: helix-turn-helix domain-containing protein [Leadbetterella sp.]
MKAKFEKIAPDTGSSFRLFRWKSENDKFFWHQHPEYEIIYVIKGSGKLHIGNYLGAYQQGEVLFLGANLPHAGLGYGVIEEHEELIIQLRDDFLGLEFMNSPEMDQIRRLFHKANHGISFSGDTRNHLEKKILQIEEKNGFDRLHALLDILKIMAESSEVKVLNHGHLKFDFKEDDEKRINMVYDFIENNFDKSIDIKHVADICSLTVPSFCRYFKKMTKMTFTDLVNVYRINFACKLLGTNKTISEICFESGFNNMSHFNKTFKTLKSKSPKEYRNEIKPSTFT